MWLLSTVDFVLSGHGLELDPVQRVGKELQSVFIPKAAAWERPAWEALVGRVGGLVSWPLGVNWA